MLQVLRSRPVLAPVSEVDGSNANAPKQVFACPVITVSRYVITRLSDSQCHVNFHLICHVLYHVTPVLPVSKQGAGRTVDPPLGGSKENRNPFSFSGDVFLLPSSESSNRHASTPPAETPIDRFLSPSHTHLHRRILLFSPSVTMNSMRIARAALRARPTMVSRVAFQRRTYADAVPDKASNTSPPLLWRTRPLSMHGSLSE